MKKSLCLFVLSASLACASASGPATPPSGEGNQDRPARGSRQSEAPELSFYNDGVKLLFKQEWAAAEKQLNAAVAINEKMAEAHNNLAYALRRQDAQNYPQSLAHCNRALELKPKLAEAYLARGTLHLLMGHADLAKADHDALVQLNTWRSRKLARQLQEILDAGKVEESEQFYGVSKKQ